MEECEALCCRLAIMVNGQFQCLGSIQHLKNKFGAGYMVTLKVGGAAEGLGEVARFMECRFGVQRAVLREQHLNQMEYQVSPTVPLATLFRWLEEGRTLTPLDDYSVTQTTLDQVFINFAKQQGDVEAEPERMDNLQVPVREVSPVLGQRPLTNPVASSGSFPGRELIELPEWVRETDIL